MTSLCAAASLRLFFERSISVASHPCVRANWTTSPIPATVSSFPEKSISVSGKGFVRSVWYPDVLEILTRGTRATGRTGGEALEQQHVWIAFGGARASMRRWRFS